MNVDQAFRPCRKPAGNVKLGLAGSSDFGSHIAMLLVWEDGKESAAAHRSGSVAPSHQHTGSENDLGKKLSPDVIQERRD